MANDRTRGFRSPARAALFHLYAGALKTLRSSDRLRPMMAWVDTVPPRTVRPIGVIEFLNAVSLLRPRLTGIAAGLSPTAAAGFVLLPAAAIRTHLAMGDREIALNITPLVVTAATAGLGFATLGA